MRFFSIIVFILFNIYLVESLNRTESENIGGRFESEKSENVRRGVDEKSDNLEDVFYEDYEYDDPENSVSGKSEKARENSTEIVDSSNSFPNEVFLSLRNITADAATAFKSFTNRNDVVDLQASASDNLNVTSNSTFGDAESAGFNLRALRDASHSPQIVDETGGAVHLPYKHTKIDTADLSDCALQGEWKPMGVAHSHLHVSGDNSHQVEILQSVGSYAVPNKVIPHWQQNLESENQDLQNGIYNHKPSGLYAGGTRGNAYGSNYGYGSGSLESGTTIGNNGVHSASHHYQGGGGGFSGASLGQFQKIKSAPMRPPVPPIIFGKKPGYWKVPKTKHKFFPGKGRRPGFSTGGSYAFLNQMNYNGGGHSGAISSNYLGHGGTKHGGGKFSISGSSGHMGHISGNGGYPILGGSGVISHGVKDGTNGLVSSAHAGHGYGGGVGGPNNGYRDGAGELSSSGGSNNGFGNGGISTSGVINHGYGNKDEESLSTGGSLSGGSAGLNHISHGAVAGHLIGGSEILQGNSGHGSEGGIEGELSSGGHVVSGSLGYVGHSSGNEVAGSHLISPSVLGSGQTVLLVHNSGNGISGGHLVAANHGGTSTGDTSLPEAAFLSTEVNKPPSGGSHYQDSTFSSSQISQGPGNGNSLPDASFLSSHINQDFAVHAKGISDDLSSSSTFTCGKNHDHNTNYHTATFQVADHDHPSSVDVLQYGGDAAVLIQSGDASFHDQILPERKHYKTSHLSDAEVSGSDNRNELVGQTAQLTSQSTKQESSSQHEADPVKLDDEEEPERHSYYHEITKVTKIPATSVGSVEYTFSKYETKPQTFSTESGTIQEEPEIEQPQIIRELEHLSNKFQLDLENPQKLFEDPPSQELAYHYPFQDYEHHHEAGEVEGNKEENHEGITEFPYQFYHNPNKVVQVNKKPVIKYIPRPGKPYFHQKVNYLQPKSPVVVLRKHKPKQFLKKQNYEVHEHSGERHKPIGEIFPPQKFPKQFHNPKPNFAVDRPKNGWRPNIYQEYKYDHSHGKKVKKFKTKAKVVAPILIRRPVSPAPVIRVVEVTGECIYACPPLWKWQGMWDSRPKSPYPLNPSGDDLCSLEAPAGIPHEGTDYCGQPPSAALTAPPVVGMTISRPSDFFPALSQLNND